MRKLELNYIINAVYILFAINVIMFLILLFNKVLGKKKRKKDESKILLYKDNIKAFLSGETKELPSTKDKESMLRFTSILLDEFDTASEDQRIKLLEISRKMGLVKSEIENLKKANKSRKAIAAYRLGEMGAVEAIDDLLNNIDRKNTELSYIIFRSLVLLSGTEYLDIIIKYLGEDDLAIKTKVSDLISTIDKQDIYPKMKEYLDSNNTIKRVIAFESLTNRGDKRIIPYIEDAIGSNDKEIKVAALKAIIGTGSLDCNKACPMVIHLKDDPDWEVRAFFANSLSICKDCTNGISILKKLAEDSNYLVRFNSSERLFALGENGLVALSELLFSRDKFAVEKAWSLINREITLYNLMDKIKDYSSYEYIIDNIERYEDRIKGGVLVGEE